MDGDHLAYLGSYSSIGHLSLAEDDWKGFGQNSISKRFVVTSTLHPAGYLIFRNLILVDPARFSAPTEKLRFNIWAILRLFRSAVAEALWFPLLGGLVSMVGHFGAERDRETSRRDL